MLTRRSIKPLLPLRVSSHGLYHGSLFDLQSSLEGNTKEKETLEETPCFLQMATRGHQCSNLAVQLSFFWMLLQLSCGGTPTTVVGRNRSSTHCNSITADNLAMHELSMSLAAQAVEIKSLQSLVQDLSDALKNTRPCPNQVSTAPRRINRPTLHKEIAVQRSGTPMLGNWTGQLDVKILTKV